MTKKISPIVGISFPVTPEKADEMRKLKCGDLIRGSLDRDKDSAIEAMRYCRENHIYVLLGECVERGELSTWSSFSKEDFEEIIAEAGEYFVARYALGEGGGVLSWPKAYTVNRHLNTWENLPPCDSPAEAHKKLVEYYKSFVDFERSQVADTKLATVDSSMILSYQAEAGIDMFSHEMCPGNPLELLPAFRGAARSFNSIWAAHIAIGWYGGIHMDELHLKRWKLCLYLAFLNGADIIYPESGHYGEKANRMAESQHNYERDHPKILRMREILREFYRFTKIHQRPELGPDSPVGVMFGNHEGFPNIWNPYAWGQYENGSEWEAGPAEKSWKLLSVFAHKENIFNENVMGEYNFSANPPGGQFDIVPLNNDISRYKCLIFLGWNTMTEEVYEKLVKYVQDGGHLLIWSAHFNAAEKRGDALKIFNDGEISKLSGIKIKDWKEADVMGVRFLTKESTASYTIPYWGLRHDPLWMGKMTPADIEINSESARIIASFSTCMRETKEECLARPALIENKLGEGVVWTVAAAEYPGDDGMTKFAEGILRIVLAGEHGSLRLLSSESIRYSTYQTEIDGYNVSIMYLLNTETDSSQSIKVWLDGKVSQEINIAASDFQLIYIIDGVMVAPECRNTRLYSVKQENESLGLEFYCLQDQKMKVCDLNDKDRIVLLNGSVDFCAKRIEPEMEEFYASDFMNEPDINQFIRQGGY